MLTQALQISPERRERWCRPVEPDFLRRLNRERPRTSEAFARLWYDDRDWQWHAHQHYDSSRYHLLNLHSVFKKGTIEFRAWLEAALQLQQHTPRRGGQELHPALHGHQPHGSEIGQRQPAPPGHR